MHRRAYIDSERLLGYGVRLRGTFHCRSMPGG